MPRRPPQAGAPGAAIPCRAADDRWRRSLFLAALVPVPAAVALRRSRSPGNRPRSLRRLLRQSGRKSAVVLARMPDCLSVPVRRRSRGPCDHLHWRCGRWRRCGSHPHRRWRASYDPGRSAPGCRVRPRRRLLRLRHELLGRRSGDLRERAGMPNRRRSARLGGSRDIHGHSPCGTARRQERRRLAPHRRAGEQEDRKRHPDRRSERGGDDGRQADGGSLHVRVIGRSAVFTELRTPTHKIARKWRFLYYPGPNDPLGAHRPRLIGLVSVNEPCALALLVLGVRRQTPPGSTTSMLRKGGSRVAPRSRRPDSNRGPLHYE